MIEAQAINLRIRRVLLSTGEMVPITCMYDEHGEETDDVDEARAVIGLMQDGTWITVDVTGFERTGVH